MTAGPRDQAAEASDALVDRHYGPLYRTAWHWTRSGAAAEDLVRETFVRTFSRTRRDFERLDETTLARAMYRLFVDSAWRESPPPEAAASVNPASTDRDGGAAERARNAARIDALWRRLPREDRALLALHDVERRPLTACAVITRLASEALEARLRRARVRLGRRLDPDRVVARLDAEDEPGQSASCRQAQRLLEDALASPDSEARSRLMQHVTTCADCRHALRALAYLRGERDRRLAPPPEGPGDALDAVRAAPAQGRPGPFWKGVIVGALLAAAVGLVAWFVIRAFGPRVFP